MAAPVSGMRATSARIRTIAVTTSASSRPAQPGGPRASPPLLYTSRLGKRADSGGGEPAQQRREHVRGSQGVRQRAVAGPDARVEMLRERGQLAVGHLLLAQQAVGQFHRVEHL